MSECFLTFFLPIAFATGVANALGVLSNLVPAGPKHAGMVVDVQQIKLAWISLAWISLAWISHHHFVGKEDAQSHNSTTKSHHILCADKLQTLVGGGGAFCFWSESGEENEQQLDVVETSDIIVISWTEVVTLNCARDSKSMRQ
jgi:hypothetical protein